MSCCGAPKNVLKPQELNRQITIQQVINTVDDEGIFVEAWSDVVTLRASRNPASSRWGEYFEAAATTAHKSVRYRIRYRKGIAPNMRLRDAYDGKTYNIVAVLDDYFGDRTQTHLMCEVIEDGQ